MERGMVRVALVEKQPSNIKYEKYFKFEFDQYQLINSKKSKILKADIDLNFNVLDEYDYVILVGAEAAKFVGKIGSVVKYAGHLVNNKYIPIFSPAMVAFKPEITLAFQQAVDLLHSQIDGSYTENLGKYTPINTEQGAIQYITEAISYPLNYFAIDTEATALYPRDGYVLGISISHKSNQGVYIDSDCITQKVETLLQKLISKKVAVMHNAKFDMKMMAYHFRFKFKKWEDTMELHYLLNENEAHSLKYLAMRYTDMGDYDRELEEFKRSYCKVNKIKLKDFTYDLIPFDIMWKYAAGDSDATIRLFEKFMPIMDKSSSTIGKAYYKILKPATLFLADVENNGVPFKKERLYEAQATLDNEIFELEAKLYTYPEVKTIEKINGAILNPGSPKQLAQLFFTVMGLPVQGKTATGAPSTDADVLDILKDMHEVPGLISKIRKLKKIKSTYIDKIITNLDSDGNLRTNFNLCVATSGRLSSSGKLNVQQFPRDNKIVKHCISSQDPDYYIVSQDLATAEMYYASVLSGDKKLQGVFARGEDFHSSIAHMIFRLPCKVEDVKKLHSSLRQQAKAVSFGIMYGAGAKTVAEQGACSVQRAQEAINTYFETFPVLKKWLDAKAYEAETRGYLYSVLGRKRRVPNVQSADRKAAATAVRSAVNFLIQSVASDINLLAGIDMNEWIKVSSCRAKIFALVHDSILAVVHKDDIQMYGEKLKEITQTDRGVSIKGTPVGVDLEIGESYAFYKEAA
ncbi:MAG: DNA polymerase [Aureispira sp.]|nr:DNA polymerase [Aureispira sp.]